MDRGKAEGLAEEPRAGLMTCRSAPYGTQPSSGRTRSQAAQLPSPGTVWPSYEGLKFSLKKIHCSQIRRAC